MRTGDIIIVDFPFTSLTETKLRPAVVVNTTNDIYNDVIACLITSVLKPELNKFEMLIKPNRENNLRAISIIKVARITTVEKARVKATIGKLSATELQQFITIFKALVG